jgi:hypothetical protein
MDYEQTNLTFNDKLTINDIQEWSVTLVHENDNLSNLKIKYYLGIEKYDEKHNELKQICEENAVGPLFLTVNSDKFALVGKITNVEFMLITYYYEVTVDFMLLQNTVYGINDTDSTIPKKEKSIIKKEVKIKRKITFY